MKRDAISGAVFAGLMACATIVGCTRPNTASSVHQKAIWAARADNATAMGIRSTVVQDGSIAHVVVFNESSHDLCLPASSWPKSELHLDQFLVEDKGRLIPFDGSVDEVIGETPQMRLVAGGKAELALDLHQSYRADWQTAQVKTFWAPFYECQG